MAPYTALVIAGLCIGVDAAVPRCIGSFEVGRHPIRLTNESVRAAAAKTRSHGCSRKTRVLAWVDAQFSPRDIEDLGWLMVSKTGDVATFQGCAETVPYLMSVPGVHYVKPPYRVFAEMDSVRKMIRADQVHGTVPGGLSVPYTGRGVLIGVVDTEFDTHHPAFLDSLGMTRFVALWDQTDTSGTPRNRFGYGVIRNQSQLRSDPSFGSDSGPTHGTLTTSLAAGSDRSTPFYGVAPGALIAAVKRSGDDNDIVDAARWIFSLADSLKMACVVNMSLGQQVGPHDGTSLIDRAIDSLSRGGRIVVGAAGNDGDGRVHVAFSLGANETKGTWVTPLRFGDDSAQQDAACGIDIWGEAGKTFSATFLILDTTTMEYRQSTVLSTSATSNYRPDTIAWPNGGALSDTLIFTARIERRNPLNSKPRILAVMYSTSPRLFLGVRLSVGGAGGTVHAWNTTKHSLRSFGMPGYIEGDNANSINEIGGTARRNITVGAYISRLRIALWDGSFHGPEIDTMRGLCPYSSQGPTIDGRTKPDITAPGSDVVGAASRTAFIDEKTTVLWTSPPTAPARYMWSGGTSISAPVVTGVVALMLQANPNLTPEQVRQILQSSAIKNAYTGPLSSPDNQWGAGMANALGCLQSILGSTKAQEPDGTPRRQIRIDHNGQGRIRVLGSTPASQQTRIDIYTLQGRLARFLTLVPGADAALPPLAGGTYLLRVRGRPETALHIRTITGTR